LPTGRRTPCCSGWT